MSLYNIDEELTTLEETKVQIKNAIIGKGQSISAEDSFRSYADKISAIDTGGIDTSDATATANDLVLNKTAYARGVKITGTVTEVPNGGSISTGFSYLTPDSSNLIVMSDFAGPDSFLMRPSSMTATTIPNATLATNIGLTPEKIKQDEVILGVVGTYYGGTDTSDATATSGDILEGKTAYANGLKLTGTIEDKTGVDLDWTFEDATLDDTLNRLDVKASKSNRIVVGTNDVTGYSSGADVHIPYSTVADVIGLASNIIKKDETILGITGTFEGLDTSDATAVAGDIAMGKTAYVNGQKVTGSVSDIVFNLQTGASNVDDMSGLSALEFSYMFNNDTLFRTNSHIDLTASYSDVANVIGLTSGIIAQGNTILGIVGTYAGIDTSDATATVDDILSGATAYVDGGKLTGTYVPVMTQTQYDNALSTAYAILGGV